MPLTPHSHSSPVQIESSCRYPEDGLEGHSTPVPVLPGVSTLLKALSTFHHCSHWRIVVGWPGLACWDGRSRDFRCELPLTEPQVCPLILVTGHWPVLQKRTRNSR